MRFFLISRKKLQRFRFVTLRKYFIVYFLYGRRNVECWYVCSLAIGDRHRGLDVVISIVLIVVFFSSSIFISFTMLVNSVLKYSNDHMILWCSIPVSKKFLPRLLAAMSLIFCWLAGGFVASIDSGEIVSLFDIFSDACFHWSVSNVRFCSVGECVYLFYLCSTCFR